MIRHAGEILRDDFLAPLGLKANRLASGLGVNRSTVGRLLSGKQRLTPELAARLGAYFGVPARWWLVMQAEFDAQLAELDPEIVADVTPVKLGRDVLLTPAGVLKLAELTPKTAEIGPQAASDGGRRVRQVRFDNGSVALIGAP